MANAYGILEGSIPTYTPFFRAMKSIKTLLLKPIVWLYSLFGKGLVISTSVILFIGLAVAFAAFFFLNTAAPRTLTISSGPNGSTFQRHAERYQKILAREGVMLKILPSEGSSDNLNRLADPKVKVDIGFVLSGEAQKKPYDTLMSLGNISVQPLMLFYTGKPRQIISEFKGKHLNIGPEGSGTNNLALEILKSNGIEPGKETRLDLTDVEDPTEDLLSGRIDAIFLMGDSTDAKVTRKLMNNKKINLYNFVQADGYVRRIKTLTKLWLPRGAMDFGNDVPADDVALVGPNIQLIARDSLHPALSDLLLEAAREIHGTAGLYRKRGEFPVQNEGEFKSSPDANRYYASGKSFLYRTFPFWLASMIARVLAVLIPLALVLIPMLKIAPAIYRWRFSSRIYKWYRVLLELERDAFKPDVNPARREELLRKLDHIESAVNRITIPAPFGDLFYGLRSHINIVRNTLNADSAPAGVFKLTPADSKQP
jgi:hypothetical protein